MQPDCHVAVEHKTYCTYYSINLTVIMGTWCVILKATDSMPIPRKKPVRFILLFEYLSSLGFAEAGLFPNDASSLAAITGNGRKLSWSDAVNIGRKGLSDSGSSAINCTGIPGWPKYGGIGPVVFPGGPFCNGNGSVQGSSGGGSHEAPNMAPGPG
jgi:hypothetical protein